MLIVYVDCDAGMTLYLRLLQETLIYTFIALTTSSNAFYGYTTFIFYANSDFYMQQYKKM